MAKNQELAKAIQRLDSEGLIYGKNYSEIRDMLPEKLKDGNIVEAVRNNTAPVIANPKTFGR